MIFLLLSEKIKIYLALFIIREVNSDMPIYVNRTVYIDRHIRVDLSDDEQCSKYAVLRTIPCFVCNIFIAKITVILARISYPFIKIDTKTVRCDHNTGSRSQSRGPLFLLFVSFCFLFLL